MGFTSHVNNYQKIVLMAVNINLDVVIANQE